MYLVHKQWIYFFLALTHQYTIILKTCLGWTFPCINDSDVAYSYEKTADQFTTYPVGRLVFTLIVLLAGDTRCCEWLAIASVALSVDMITFVQYR